MKVRVDWQVFLLTIGVVAVVAFGAARLLDLSFLPTFVLTMAAVLVNGLIATLEDDLPGGFDNPDGDATPAYASHIVRVARWLLAAALLTFAMAFPWSWFAGGTRAELPVVVGIALACSLLALALLVRRRVLLLAALVSGLGGIAVSALVR